MSFLSLAIPWALFYLQTGTWPHCAKKSPTWHWCWMKWKHFNFDFEKKTWDSIPRTFRPKSLVIARPYSNLVFLITEDPFTGLRGTLKPWLALPITAVHLMMPTFSFQSMPPSATWPSESRCARTGTRTFRRPPTPRRPRWPRRQLLLPRPLHPHRSVTQRGFRCWDRRICFKWICGSRV